LKASVFLGLCGIPLLGTRAFFIRVLVGLIACFFAILAGEPQGLASDSVLEERGAYVSNQVEALLRFSETSRKSMEEVYKMVHAARYQTPESVGEGKNPAARKAAPLNEKNAKTDEKPEEAAGEMIFRITRKVWALSKNTRFYHYESLAMVRQSVVDDQAFERYKEISEVLQSQFDSLNGDIEKLRVLCSGLGPKEVPLRKLRELSEKTAQLAGQIRGTMKELTIEN
jgi:ribosomal protein L12E/L44/L45/RPP1/RPP2